MHFDDNKEMHQLRLMPTASDTGFRRPRSEHTTSKREDTIKIIRKKDVLKYIHRHLE